MKKNYSTCKFRNENYRARFYRNWLGTIYRPFFILACPSKIFVPIPQGHVSKRFPEEKKISGGMSQHRDLVKSIFCRFFNGKMPKISKNRPISTVICG